MKWLVWSSISSGHQEPDGMAFCSPLPELVHVDASHLRRCSAKLAWLPLRAIQLASRIEQLP